MRIPLDVLPLGDWLFFLEERVKNQLLVIIGIVLFALSGCQNTLSVSQAQQPLAEVIPVARQGIVVEVISPDEVMVEAYGIYYGQGSTKAKLRDIAENGNELALLDARRTSIYILLFEGVDPILNTKEEQLGFEKDKAFFYSLENLKRYITYEDSLFNTNVKIEDGTGLKVSKRFKINKERLLQDLVDRHIITARETILESIGNPLIMVIPDVEFGQNPLEVLGRDPVARQASTVIQSYLTVKGYEVVVPEQSSEISSIVSAQKSFDGAADFSYMLALNIGSDVYVKFSGYTEAASFGTTRYVARLNIYESTTARLLGSETGYSKGRKGDLMVSVEEALNDAIDRALNRVMNYWQSDLKKGVQYKVVINLNSGLDSSDVDSIQLAFMEAISEIALSSRELVLTKETIDYLIWVDPARFDRSLQVYQALKVAFEQQGTGAVMGRISMNRKLMQLAIEY
jgi:hypothetical protein